MRKSSRTPRIVPRGDDQNVYLDLGRLGRIWREADYEATDFETVVTDLLDGQYKNPTGIFAFNAAEGWARDVSADVAAEPTPALRSAAVRRAIGSAANGIPMWRVKPFSPPYEAIVKRSSAMLRSSNMGAANGHARRFDFCICLGVMIVGIAVLGSGLAALVLT